jgi:solute carrier family 15 oligopeptide transporter 1
MAIAIIVFVIGTKKYKRDDERNKKGSIITKTFLCICIAIKNKIMSSKGFKKEHWLDYAETKYSAQMINDVKAFCKVVFVFLPLPVFWALYVFSFFNI